MEKRYRVTLTAAERGDLQKLVRVGKSAAQKLVRASLGGIMREAKFYGDQGCIIHPEGHDGIYFTPVPVKTRLQDAASQPSPLSWITCLRRRCSVCFRGGRLPLISFSY